MIFRIAFAVTFSIIFTGACGLAGPSETNPNLPAGMAFVQVPRDSFSMGSLASELGSWPDERPVHIVAWVDLSKDMFGIMTTEVTQGMWVEVMGSNPSYFSTAGLDHPVEKVSWDDCQLFIAEINKLDPSHNYRLPSEAEWEYACRAGTTTRFYWGDDLDSTQVDNYAWTSQNSSSTTHPVAQKIANNWGLYDMSGNVREWCEDWYHSDYVGAPTDGSAWISGGGTHRVLRGGAWSQFTWGCRSAFRYYFSTGWSDYTLGFRLARD